MKEPECGLQPIIKPTDKYNNKSLPKRINQETFMSVWKKPLSLLMMANMWWRGALPLWYRLKNVINALSPSSIPNYVCQTISLAFLSCIQNRGCSNGECRFFLQVGRGFAFLADLSLAWHPSPHPLPRSLSLMGIVARACKALVMH